MNEPIIETHSLSRRFGSLVAVKDVSLSVTRGAFAAIARASAAAAPVSARSISVPPWGWMGVWGVMLLLRRIQELKIADIFGEVW